eukprot:c9396_g1_i1 orf=3-515(-)
MQRSTGPDPYTYTLQHYSDVHINTQTLEYPHTTKGQADTAPHHTFSSAPQKCHMSIMTHPHISTQYPSAHHPHEKFRLGNACKALKGQILRIKSTYTSITTTILLTSHTHTHMNTQIQHTYRQTYMKTTYRHITYTKTQRHRSHVFYYPHKYTHTQLVTRVHIRARWGGE